MMNGSKMTFSGFAERRLLAKKPPGYDSGYEFSLEKELRRYILFKNDAVCYRDELRNPGISKVDFGVKRVRHSYNALEAIEIATKIVNNSYNRKLNEVLDIDMDQLMKEIIEFEEMSGKTIKACAH